MRMQCLELEQCLEHKSNNVQPLREMFSEPPLFLLNRLVVHVLVRICYRTPLKKRLCVSMFYSLLVRVQASARRHRRSERDLGLFKPAGCNFSGRLADYLKVGVISRRLGQRTV
jgi:hypothetical protein